MAKEFKTRKGRTYYIKSRTTKKGNTTYFMTAKLDEECLNKSPDGYEVFEKYDTEIFYIRKKKELNFSNEDLTFIKKELKNNSSIDAYELDVNGGEIKIYTAEKGNGMSSLKSLLSLDKQKMAFLGKALLSYEERLKIQVEGKEYIVMRYCYRGSVDDWIVIDAGDNLQELAKKNIIHLGKESYFELYRIR